MDASLMMWSRDKARLQRRSDLTGSAYGKLHDEFLAAFARGSLAEVATPGFCQKQNTIAYIVSDDLAGDDEATHTLLAMISAASQGEDIQLRASAWIAAQARRHATWHADDLALEMESAESVS